MTIKRIILVLVLFTFVSFDSRQTEAFAVGEWFTFRIHYGLVNAGYTTLQVKEATINNKKVFHVIGRGYTTGLSKFFFKIEDVYESYIDKETRNPYQFVRKIDEGGYTKNEQGFFNQAENRILVKDYKSHTEQTFDIPVHTQDILSSFYYLRNYPNIDKLKTGEFVAIDMFFDDRTTKFRLKFIGRENIKTKFGVVAAMIFRPFVQSGRIFKEEESLTIWISDDDNKIPLKIKANLAVGSIKAELEGFKGLHNPFKLIVKNKVFNL